MMYLITYDITHNSTRNKVAKMLQAKGYERIQYSVFAGPDSPVENTTLWERLVALCDNTAFPEDKIFVIAVSNNSFKNMKKIGNLGLDMEYLTGEKHTWMM